MYFLGLQYVLDLLDVIDHSDSVAAVGYLPRLYYVDVFRLSRFSILFGKVLPVTAHLRNFYVWVAVAKE
jgi:hypothetical protein